MTRKDFLQRIGIGAAFVLTTSCFQSCAKEVIGPIDFTLDLDLPANAKLKTNGEYLVTNSCVVAKTINGDYVAATVICSHEQRKEVLYDSSGDQFYCTAHGAQFDLAGNGLNSNGRKGLTIYKTTLSTDGRYLRVYSV
ncbi:MAG: Rieske 2Fe-2S domain-containing protein [Saprospiraceae bacterium]|nr:Rieske 2Fe-2S domain-containing protein [Saprospiraceae bacterium]MBK7796999.1 Rieske 2Fe-2S domain-containing protein [Saprospiraceae bacterium]MBK8152198.1 Rieske 2Fe-2S domain-containing protein [Saprospiraceae bacterium]MBK9377524.1 Rieske 2Fe-2S domain-containing protein [Saprospiraceae bacterium]MBL0259609.1 Rieske 2Fe-2S domain-containing protein [Saprospiraceae bacterium]